MQRETSGFGEQAINKMAKMAIARQLKEVDDLEVHIQTDLNKLAHGKLDSIAIKITGLLMQSRLKAEEFYLQIGQVTVKPLSALRGKIQLLHPSEGTLSLVVEEASLTAALNAESGVRSRQSEADEEAGLLSSIQCRLADGLVTFHTQAANENADKPPLMLTTTPQVTAEGRGINLVDVHYIEGCEPSPQFTAALLAQIVDLLSLEAFGQQGTLLEIQQVAAVEGRLTIQANAHIEQFPSS